MARYNEKAVINFLLGLEYNSTTEFIYRRTAAVVNHFGCTPATANKWINRATNTGLIEADSCGFKLVNQEENQAQEAKRSLLQSEVDAGRVVRLSSARIKRNGQAEKV